MKKLIAMLLALTTAAALTACSKQTEPSPTDPTIVSTEPTAVSTEPVDNLVEVERIVSVRILWEQADSEPRELRVEYDGADPLKLSLNGEDDYPCQWSFHPDGNALKTFLKDYTREEYDQQGNCTAIYLTDEGKEYLHIRSEYNSQGLPTAMTEYDKDGETVCVDCYDYDEKGREIRYEHSGADDTKLVTWTYDEADRLLEYRSEGTYYDEGTYSLTQNTYNEAGQLIRSHNEGSDPANEWDYDSAYVYDDAGNRIEENQTHEDETVSDSWTYDENGNLLSSVTHYNMDGWVTCITDCTYNEEGLLTSEDYQEEYDGDVLCASRRTLTYSAEGRLIEEVTVDAEINGEGEPVFEDASTLRTVYQYDTTGRLTERYQYQGDQIEVFLWTYDEDGALMNVSNSRVADLAQPGEKIFTVITENELTFHVAAAYETVSVTAEEAQIIENMNKYLLSAENSYFYS